MREIMAHSRAMAESANMNSCIDVYAGIVISECCRFIFSFPFFLWQN